MRDERNEYTGQGNDNFNSEDRFTQGTESGELDIAENTQTNSADSTQNSGEGIRVAENNARSELHIDKSRAESENRSEVDEAETEEQETMTDSAEETVGQGDSQGGSGDSGSAKPQQRNVVPFVSANTGGASPQDKKSFWTEKNAEWCVDRRGGRRIFCGSHPLCRGWSEHKGSVQYPHLEDGHSFR